MEGASGVTLNAASVMTCSGSRPSRPTPTISPRAWVWCGRRGDDRRTLLRGNAGLFFDRVPLRAVANALLSAGNTTDLANLRQIGVTLAPSQAGAPAFPDILPAVIPSVTLPNLTTMDRHLQNAYSRQMSVEIEQQVGARRHGEHRLSAPAGRAAHHGHQSECSDVCGLGDQQRLPAGVELREQQPVLVCRELGVRRIACVVDGAAVRVGKLPALVHVFEVDEQRGRGLLQRAHRPHRPLQGLGPVRRRPASSAGRERHRSHVNGAGNDDVGARESWLPDRAACSRPTRSCR